MTIEQTRKELSPIINVHPDNIRICISGQCSSDDYTIEYYKNKYPTNSFFVLLNERTPKDLVHNFQTIQRLNGSFQPHKECVVCFETPNVSNSLCYHDAILCIACARKLKNCPFCEQSLVALERV